MNLPMDLLRSFVTVIEMESYTQAAHVLGRTQPAVSLQIRRLEEIIGYKLIVLKGRGIALTEQGEELAQHARQILRLNDLAISRFDRSDDQTGLRIGLPLDYAVDVLQTHVSALLRKHPDAAIELHCALSKNLLDALQSDEIDIVVALFAGTDQQFLFRQWRESPIWAGATDFVIPASGPIPLAAHPAGCPYRTRMSEALKRANKSWRIAYTSPSINGLQDAVLKGLGITCLTGATLSPGLRKLTAKDGLPDPAPLHIGLFFRQTRLGNIGHEAVDLLVATLDQVALPDHI
ncbi:MAG: LysR substrate-binding domain-containing protein [Roseobacter sp.]